MELGKTLSNRIVYIVLICLGLFFLLTRVYKIAQIPPSLYWDEASIGYNAYSILKTGKDEWGETLPLHFRAFGEFKLPVYIYSVVPFIKVFGLTSASVRLPAVIYSLATLVVMYFLGAKIGSKLVGIFSAFFFTLSQWDFIFSRTGYEASAGLFFFLLGIYLFLKSFDNSKYFFLVTLSLVVSAYSYNSFRILSLITFPFLVILYKYKKEVGKKTFLLLLLSVLFFLLSLFPVYRLFKYDSGGVRLGSVGIELTDRKQFLISFAKNYLSHFSPQFLLTHGDINMRSQMKGFGELSLIEVPLILVGLFYIIKKRNTLALVPLLLLLIAPIPAALTKESPHGLRSILMSPSFTLISALGLSFLMEKYKKYSKLLAFIFILCFLAFFVRYFLRFVSVYGVQSSQDWQYGYKQIFTGYSDEINKASKVIISEEYAQPYIFALYYQKIDSEYFKNSAHYNTPDRWGFSTVSSFGKFEFKKIDSKDLQKGNLIFAIPSETHNMPLPKNEIKFLNGQSAFFVYKP